MMARRVLAFWFARPLAPSAATVIRSPVVSVTSLNESTFARVMRASYRHDRRLSPRAGQGGPRAGGRPGTGRTAGPREQEEDTMTKASITGPDGGDVIPLGPTTMRILEDGSTTGHRLGVGEITVAPHSGGPAQHRHARHDEGFYVVSGTARFTVGAESYDVPAGGLAMIPPGAPHTFANPGGEPLVLLNTFTPDLYVQYFRDLRAMIERGGALTPEATVQVMSRYATEPATSYPDDPGTTTYQVPTSAGEIPVTVTQRGQGRPVLLLHGGAGLDSVAGFAALLAERLPAQVLTPVHPGFGGTPRPAAL